MSLLMTLAVLHKKYEHNVEWHCCPTVHTHTHIFHRQTTEWTWTKLGSGSQHYTPSDEFNFRSNRSVVTHTSLLFTKHEWSLAAFHKDIFIQCPSHTTKVMRKINLQATSFGSRFDPAE